MFLKASIAFSCSIERVSVTKPSPLSWDVIARFPFLNSFFRYLMPFFSIFVKLLSVFFVYCVVKDI